MGTAHEMSSLGDTGVTIFSTLDISFELDNNTLQYPDDFDSIDQTLSDIADTG